MSQPPTGTLALLFSDIEGSTRLWESHPDAMASALQRHDALVRGAIAASGGHVFKTVGDAFCAAFASPVAAVRAAVAVQEAMQDSAWQDPVRPRVRIGVHTGCCHERDGDYFGPTVNRVARLQAVAHGGQVVISGTTREAVRGALPDWIVVRDLGWHHLRDLGEPEHVFQVEARGLGVEFPPLRSLERRGLQHNLPAMSSTFIGRTQEVAEIRELLAVSRLVTITGPGGAGKTRVALAVAAELIDRSRDGVWLVELAAKAVDDEVAGAAAAALGVRSGSATGLDELIVAIRDQRMLLIIDNCEHVLDGVAEVVARVLREAPGVRVLATSRERIGVAGEKVWRIPPMKLAAEPDATTIYDAAALLIERAANHGAHLEMDAATFARANAVCARLDGLPLAIELAAARLVSLPLAEIEARLDERLRLLTTGSRGVPSRQGTLRASVAWSYDLLRADEQLLLCRLSVFADSGFDVAAASAVCGATDARFADLLDALVAKSLVVGPERGRYRLLETISEFAAERLSDHEREHAQLAHRDHFRALAQEASTHLAAPDQGEWHARLHADHGNLRVALHSLDAAEQIGVVASLKRYWIVRSHEHEALAILRHALADAALKPGERLLALLTAAELALFVGRDAQGSYGDDALVAARESGDGAALARALITICQRAYMHRDDSAELADAEGAVRAARQSGDPVLFLEALAFCGRMDPSSEQCRTWLIKARTLAEATGDRLVLIVVLNELGSQALARGDLDTAGGLFDHALTMSREIQIAAPPAMLNLAWVRLRQGAVEQATALARDGLRLARRRVSPSLVAYALLILACCSTAREEPEEALALHAAADRALAASGERWVEPDRGFREEDLAELRSALQASYELALLRARTISEEAALDLALGRYGSRSAAPHAAH